VRFGLHFDREHALAFVWIVERVSQRVRNWSLANFIIIERISAFLFGFRKNTVREAVVAGHARHFPVRVAGGFAGLDFHEDSLRARNVIGRCSVNHLNRDVVPHLIPVRVLGVVADRPISGSVKIRHVCCTFRAFPQKLSVRLSALQHDSSEPLDVAIVGRSRCKARLPFIRPKDRR